MSSTSNSTFEPSGTVQTRADALRVGDRIFVRHDDEDLWAQVTAIKPTGDPDVLRLELELEADGASVGTCRHTAPLDRVYLRMVPVARPAHALRATTECGLVASASLYCGNWDRDGTVSVCLPTSVAHQVLDDRGWAHIRDDDGGHYAWDVPSGDRFWHTDEAVKFALTAECADSRMVASPRPA